MTVFWTLVNQYLYSFSVDVTRMVSVIVSQDKQRPFCQLYELSVCFVLF